MNITIIMKTNQLKRITIETPNLLTHTIKKIVIIINITN
jgi:hypothetical protein